MIWLVLALGGVAALLLGLGAYGSMRWTNLTRALLINLESTRTAVTTKRYDSRELDGLPAPVQRYFRAVLKDGQPMVTAVTIDIAGTFNMSATGEQWKPFTSRQRVVTARPGFLWDARIAMLPGLPVRVVDSYIAGKGMLHAAVRGLFTVAEISGGGEIARGEFMRYFAEAAWYPTALLPSQGVRWEAVDDRSRECHHRGRFAYADPAVQVQRRRPDRLVPRRGARRHGRQGNGHGPVGRSLVQLPDARWNDACHSLARWHGCGRKGANRTSSAPLPR